MSQVKSKKTVAERVAQFKVQNPEQMKIHRLKESVKKSQRGVHDDQYNEEVKKKQREKKRRQRAEKKNEKKEANVSAAKDSVDGTTSEEMSASALMDSSSPLDSSSPRDSSSPLDNSPPSSSRNRLVVKFQFNKFQAPPQSCDLNVNHARSMRSVCIWFVGFFLSQ